MNNNPAYLKIGQAISNNNIKRRDVLLSGGSLLAASALMGGAHCSCNQQAGQRSGGCCSI